MKLLSLLTLAAALSGGIGVGDEGGVLRGTIRAEDSLEPVPYAVVQVIELERTVVADARGYYVLPSLPAGRWTVQASAMGYEPVSITVVSAGSGAVTMDFQLPLRPVSIPGVNTRASRRPAAPIVDQPGTPVGPPSVRLAGPALQLLPGLAEPDILRSLQILPSVAATSDYSSALYVRGGSSDQTLLTLDGFPLFNPYHMGGIFSALPTDAIASVEVWPGAAPARSSAGLSGGVEMRTRDGARDGFRSRGSIGLLSTTVGIEGPLPGGGGSYLLSGRRTYLDAVSRAAEATGLIPDAIPYGLGDVYGKLSHGIGESGTLTLSGYVDGERFRMVAPDYIGEMTETETDFDWGSRMLGLAYRAPLASDLLVEVRAGYSGFRGGFSARDIWLRYPLEGGDPADAVIDTTRWLEAGVEIDDFMGALDLTWYGQRHTLRAGAQIDDYRLSSHLGLLDDREPAYFPPFQRAATPRTMAYYLEDEWRPGGRLRLRAGARYLDAGRLGSAWLPRVGVGVELTPALSLTAGAGMNAQVLRSMKDEESIAASFIAYDVLDAQPSDAGLARSWDVVAGAEWRGREASVRVEGFAKRMEGLVLAPEPLDPMLAPPLITDSFRLGEGRAAGFELLATARLGETDLTAAYTLLSAGRNAGEGWYTPRFERRHTLDLNAATPTGGNGLVTARLVVATGQPYTPIIGKGQPFSYSPAHGWTSGHSAFALLGEQNSERLPGYLRFDVAYRTSFERTLFGRQTTLTPYFQVVNLFNSKNTLIGVPEPHGQLRLKYLPQLPILPTFGLEWHF